VSVCLRGGRQAEQIESAMSSVRNIPRIESSYFISINSICLYTLWGVKDKNWIERYPEVLTDMIRALQKIEDFMSSKQNLLTKFQPKDRSRSESAELSKYLDEQPQ
jgi:hypothetical protein